jgi:hypothetical protein
MLATRPIRRTDSEYRKTRTNRFRPTGRSATVVKLLNEDFLRECREVFACAVFVERLSRVKPAVARRIERRGRGAVTHALTLCQLIQDLGGEVTENLDESDAVRNAQTVVTREWTATTRRRLRERADQLRAVNYPILATRVDHLLAEKWTEPTLFDLT